VEEFAWWAALSELADTDAVLAVIRLRGTNCPYQQWFRIRHLAALDSSAQGKTVGMNAATNEAVAE
jgi:hypothetical protein